MRLRAWGWQGLQWLLIVATVVICIDCFMYLFSWEDFKAACTDMLHLLQGPGGHVIHASSYTGAAAPLAHQELPETSKFRGYTLYIICGCLLMGVRPFLQHAGASLLSSLWPTGSGGGWPGPALTAPNLWSRYPPYGGGPIYHHMHYPTFNGGVGFPTPTAVTTWPAVTPSSSFDLWGGNARRV